MRKSEREREKKNHLYGIETSVHYDFRVKLRYDLCMFNVELFQEQQKHRCQSPEVT